MPRNWVGGRQNRDAQGQAGDGAQIGSDIFPYAAVTAGSPKRKDAIIVVQNDRQAVQFWLQQEICISDALVKA